MSDDCISRQAALDAIDKWCMGEGDEGIYTIVENLPSVTPKPIITNKSAVFWLENITEKYLKGDTFEDRQMKKSINKAIKALSKEPKTGHWIEDTNGTYTDNHDTWECSECGHAQILLEGTPKDNDYNYCPNCGAKMVEPQERNE